MEEDIKILDEVVGRSKELREKDFGMLIGTKQMQSIENLIKGYRELDEIYERLLREYELRGEHIEIFKKNYIPKSKIKQRIEELEESMNKAKPFDISYIEYCEDRIEVLQELMEDK